jgi:hypothetical protein
MATAEQLEVLRAMVGGDFERQEVLTNRLHEAGGLDDYGTVIGAAFFLAVRKQFPQRYSAEDVIRLVADTRALIDQTGDQMDPRAAELVVRSALGESGLLANVSDEAVVQAQVAISSYLAGEGKLGDPDAFMAEVKNLLEEWSRPANK